MPFGHALSGVRVQKVQRVKGFRGCGLPLRGNEYKAGVTGLLSRRTSHPAFTSIPSLTILTDILCCAQNDRQKTGSPI